jgi:tetratricopeptide (TPR) repeat protein
LNSLAWLRATCSDPPIRRPDEAVKLAGKAADLAPEAWPYWETLGVAHYRAGDWDAAVRALSKSAELNDRSSAATGFFLAMAHWRKGDKDQARRCYDRTIDGIAKNHPQDPNGPGFRAEAAALLGLADHPEAPGTKEENAARPAKP